MASSNNSSSGGLATSDIIGIAVGVPSGVLALAGVIIAFCAWQFPDSRLGKAGDSIKRHVGFAVRGGNAKGGKAFGAGSTGGAAVGGSARVNVFRGGEHVRNGDTQPFDPLDVETQAGGIGQGGAAYGPTAFGGDGYGGKAEGPHAMGGAGYGGNAQGTYAMGGWGYGGDAKTRT